MDLEKYLFIMDVTNIDDLYAFYMEMAEEIKKTLYAIVHNSSVIATSLNRLTEREPKIEANKAIKNIESLIFNYNTICGQAKGILERINQLKKAQILPVSI